MKAIIATEQIFSPINNIQIAVKYHYEDGTSKTHYLGDKENKELSDRAKAGYQKLIDSL